MLCFGLAYMSIMCLLALIIISSVHVYNFDPTARLTTVVVVISSFVEMNRTGNCFCLF